MMIYSYFDLAGDIEIILCGYLRPVRHKAGYSVDVLTPPF